MCIRDRLRTVRQARVCDCPSKQLPLQYNKRNSRTIWLMVKLAVFYGIVYVTHDLRIWTTSDETERIYLRMHDTVQAVFGDTDDLTKKLQVKCLFKYKLKFFTEFRS